MHLKKDRLRFLFERYFQNIASPEETSELLQLIEQGNHDNELKALLGSAWEKYEGEGEIIPRQKSEAILQFIVQQENAGRQGLVRNIKSRMAIYRKMTAAAAIIIFFSSIFWLLFFNKETARPRVAQRSHSTPPVNPILPGTNGAILTLDNGQQIVLDSAGNGILALQGGTEIVKAKDGLSYRANTHESETVYNTITTPRGRQYPNLILADGSKVWLDAGSSIRFPVAFNGQERKVEITGQAWFEVVHDVQKPFVVMANNVAIYDLGTQFNVNAYHDEQDLKVSLLQGAVKIHSITLKPGQQASVMADGKLTVKDNVNMEEVIAWKKGYFNFNNVELKSVMRQLSRWYDIQVSYQGDVPDIKFKGEIGRNLTLQEVLDGLSFMNLKFKIEGRHLVVLP